MPDMIRRDARPTNCEVLFQREKTMRFENAWNNRILIADDQESIHQDFEEMLKPGLAESSADDLARAFNSESDESFLPEFELLHAAGGEEAYETIKKGIETGNPIAVAYICRFP